MLSYTPAFLHANIFLLRAYYGSFLSVILDLVLFTAYFYKLEASALHYIAP